MIIMRIFSSLAIEAGHRWPIAYGRFLPYSELEGGDEACPIFVRIYVMAAIWAMIKAADTRIYLHNPPLYKMGWRLSADFVCIKISSVLFYLSSCC
jgi:hypothetical protein